jgi:hypothetical protein
MKRTTTQEREETTMLGDPAARRDLAQRDQTPSEVVAMIKRELEARQTGSGAEIHIHYHAGAPSAPAPPAAHTDAPNAADRLVPYFVILLGGAIILAIIGVITVLLVPAIMALATMIAIVTGGVAIMFVAVAAATRSLRQTGADRQIMKQRLGRRR